MRAAVTGPQAAKIHTEVKRRPDGGSTLWAQGADIDAVAIERAMPGAAEVLPTLHVSSFASWDAVVSHWSALLRASQPAPGSDPELRTLATRLVADAPDDAAKISALLRWVADQIRYVGLEFGVHSSIQLRHARSTACNLHSLFSPLPSVLCNIMDASHVLLDSLKQRFERRFAHLFLGNGINLGPPYSLVIIRQQIDEHFQRC